MDKNQYEIQGSPCNPWYIYQPEEKDNYPKFTWQPQITAPMPLEAINELFYDLQHYIEDAPSQILTRRRKPLGVIHMTQDFFQSKPEGNAHTDIKDDVYGFLSLLVTYAVGVSIPFFPGTFLAGYKRLGQGTEFLTYLTSLELTRRCIVQTEWC